MIQIRTVRTMNCKRPLHLLLAICAFCISAPVAAAGDQWNIVKLERFSLTLAGATTIGSLDGRPAAANRSFTERSFDFGAAQPHARRWLLNFTFRSAETVEPGGLAASTPLVGEPRGNELLLWARYDF